MPSDALQVLAEGLVEVSDLLRADPTPRGGLPRDPALTRAVTRSCIVILAGHFERYLRSVNEEAVALVNQSQVRGESLPERLRLQHSRAPVDRLAVAQWTHRAGGLRLFAQSDAWLWSGAQKGVLDHGRIMEWLKSPKAKSVIRFYRLWGVDDMFAAITRAANTRRYLFLKITELVEKRNNIAHGDMGTEATTKEVREYQETVRVFCSRADRRLGRELKGPLRVGCPWY